MSSQRATFLYEKLFIIVSDHLPRLGLHPWRPRPLELLRVHARQPVLLHRARVQVVRDLKVKFTGLTQNSQVDPAV